MQGLFYFTVPQNFTVRCDCVYRWRHYRSFNKILTVVIHKMD